jgi:hypothetical protein
MCKEVSAIALKDERIVFGDNDSHSDIIDQHKLHEYGVRGVNLVKLELVPKNSSDPIKKWKFIVDQDELPEWWDHEKYEKKLRGVVRKSGLSAAIRKRDKVRDAAEAEYVKVRDAAWAEYWKVAEPARAEYEKVVKAAEAEYWKVKEAAWAEYWKVRDAAEAEYEKVREEIAKKVW